MNDEDALKLTGTQRMALGEVAVGRWRVVSAGMLEVLYSMKLIDVRYNLTDAGRGALRGEL